MERRDQQVAIPSDLRHRPRPRIIIVLVMATVVCLLAAVNEVLIPQLAHSILSRNRRRKT